MRFASQPLVELPALLLFALRAIFALQRCSVLPISLSKQSLLLLSLFLRRAAFLEQVGASSLPASARRLLSAGQSDFYALLLSFARQLFRELFVAFALLQVSSALCLLLGLFASAALLLSSVLLPFRELFVWHALLSLSFAQQFFREQVVSCALPPASFAWCLLQGRFAFAALLLVSSVLLLSPAQFVSCALLIS